MEDIVLNEQGQVVLPQPGEITEKAKDDAMGAYLMMFAAWGIGLPIPLLSLLAAFIYHMLNRKESRFTAFHSYQSLLSETIVSLLNTVLIVWAIVVAVSPVLKTNVYLISFTIFTVLWNLIYMIISIVACVQAKKGLFFYMPVLGRIVFNKYYGRKARETQIAVKSAAQNYPPKDY